MESAKWKTENVKARIFRFLFAHFPFVRKLNLLDERGFERL